MTRRPPSRTAVRTSAAGATSRTPGGNSGTPGFPAVPALTTRLKLQALAVASAFGSLAAGLTVGSGGAFANPVAPQVVNGQATFNAAGNTLTITNTPGAVINWQSFSIGASELTKFNQQSASSAVLNRVVGADPSSILGQLQSNGKVFLINPAGIVFGQGAKIDVAGFAASTANISNADFIAGRNKFEAGALQGNIVNQGTITAASGGTIMLIGKDVSNQGIIRAPNGQIVLAAGQSVEVIDTATPGVKVVFTATANKAENLGELVSQNVNIAGALLRNKGIINANQVSRDAQGRIVLSASKSVTLESGSTITANGPQGGTVTMTAGNEIKVEGNTVTQANASAGPGGSISLKTTEAGGKIAVDAGALIQANGASAGSSAALAVPNPGQAGGFIAIEAVKGSTTVAGALEARGIRPSLTVASGTAPGAASGASASAAAVEPATGGTVQVLGAQVALLGEARVDASGTDGGGVILVGGDYQGKNASIQNALTTFVDRDVILKADADLTANGGKVVVWADNATHFVGSISGRGGRLGGNGGFAEVSGKEYLFFRGRVDLGANKGEGGTLLLDPRDITLIRTSSSNGSFSSGTFTPSGDNAVADIAAIETSLNGGTSVDIRTSGGGGSQSGDITIAAGESINKTGTGTATLRLNAERNIIVSAGVTIQQTTNVGGSDRLNVVFNADSDANNTGYIGLNGVNGSGITIGTNGGNITLGGRDSTLSGTVTGVATGDATTGTGVNISRAVLNAGAGNITVYGKGGTLAGGNNHGVLIVASSVIAGSINITGTGGTAGTNNYGINITANGTVVQAIGAGGLTLAGTGGSVSTASNFGVYISGGNAGSGALVRTIDIGNLTITSELFASLMEAKNA